MAQTVSEYNNDVDVRFYFSKKPIQFTSQYRFTLTDGIRIDFDNSNSYNLSTVPRLKQYSASGQVSVGNNENVYTNATFAYTSAPLHPALDMDTYELKGYFVVFAFVVALVLIFHAVSVWLRGR